MNDLPSGSLYRKEEMATYYVRYWESPTLPLSTEVTKKKVMQGKYKSRCTHKIMFVLLILSCIPDKQIPLNLIVSTVPSTDDVYWEKKGNGALKMHLDSSYNFLGAH